MRRQLAAGIAACCLLAIAAVPSRSQEQLEVLETALVVGDQPGPGLWKVTRGDNVIWVLGSTRLTPAGATWQSGQVKARIAESQEVLYPPIVQVEPSMNALSIVAVLPFAIGIDKIPDGKKLQQVLSPERYAQWRAMREKYIDPNTFLSKEFLGNMERQRPVLLASHLGLANARAGLANGQVDRLVRETAQQHMVPIRRLPTLSRAVRVESLGRIVRDARKKVQQAEMDCFLRRLDSVEADLEDNKQRANAWARGDIARLRALPQADQRSDDCIYAMVVGYTRQDGKNAAKARKIMADFEWHEEQGVVQAQRDWVAAARKALEVNASTFAVLPIDDVLRADGHLAALRALGYTVEDPL